MVVNTKTEKLQNKFLDWDAVFWDENSVELCNFFIEKNLPSSSDVYCEHSTVEFNPSDDKQEEYKQYFGSKQKFKVLGWARDDHCQV